MTGEDGGTRLEEREGQAGTVLSLGSTPGSATHVLPVALGPGDGFFPGKMG